MKSSYKKIHVQNIVWHFGVLDDHKCMIVVMQRFISFQVSADSMPKVDPLATLGHQAYFEVWIFKLQLCRHLIHDKNPNQ